jgi:hypothetical protein
MPTGRWKRCGCYTALLSWNANLMNGRSATAARHTRSKSDGPQWHHATMGGWCIHACWGSPGKASDPSGCNCGCRPDHHPGQSAGVPSHSDNTDCAGLNRGFRDHKPEIDLYTSRGTTDISGTKPTTSSKCSASASWTSGYLAIPGKMGNPCCLHDSTSLLVPRLRRWPEYVWADLRPIVNALSGYSTGPTRTLHSLHVYSPRYPQARVLLNKLLRVAQLWSTPNISCQTGNWTS